MKTSPLDFLLCGTAITLMLAAAFGLVWLLHPWSKGAFAEYHVIVDLFALMLAYGLLSALVLRVLLRFNPILPGEYDQDSPVFTFWKLITIIHRMGLKALRPFTTEFTRTLVESLFGAKIGANVAIGATLDDPYQVTIGDGAVLGFNALISGNVLQSGKLTCGPVKIGAGALIGVNSVILPGTEIGENAVLLGGSYVVPGTKIPAGETWRGNPARKWL